MDISSLLLFSIVIGFILLISGVGNGKKRRRRRKTSKGKTVAYIIIKDGYGKFGITTCGFYGKMSESKSVNKRYNNEPLRILWAKTLPTRAAAYRFESWCKKRVVILKGKEWFSASKAEYLVEIASKTW